MACCTWKAESSAEAEAAERMVDDVQTFLELHPRPDRVARAAVLQTKLGGLLCWSALDKELLGSTRALVLRKEFLEIWRALVASERALPEPKRYVVMELPLPGLKWGQETVDAIFKALASIWSTVVKIELTQEIFGTAESAVQLGQCLNTNATLQELVVSSVRGLGKSWLAAFSNSLTGNATLRTLRIGINTSNSVYLAASINRFAGLTDLTITVWPSGRIVKVSRTVLLTTAKALLQNSSTKLERLTILCDNPSDVPSSVCKKVAQMLRSNSALKSLEYGHRFQFKGSAVVNSMSLNHRLGLEKLVMRLDDDGSAALFRLLTPRPGHAPAQSAAPASLYVDSDASGALSQLRELSLPYCGGDTQAALAGMLAFNTTLVKLHLQYASYSTKQWVAILPELASNTTLQTLDLGYCDGVDGEEVYKVLTDLVTANTVIRGIDLGGTPLAQAGKAGALKEAIRRNVEYRASLGVVPKMRPKSGRLVLCGSPFAGKSTLLDTMLRIKQQHMATPHERGETSDPTLRKPPLANSAGERPRTRGIEVVTLRDDKELRISVWDFAGQQEYHALHDCVFPDTNGSAIFLFACNPTDPIESNRVKHFRQQLEYWLRFICSNSRPKHSIKPLVIVVVTHQDEPEAAGVHELDVLRIVEELANRFSSLVHVEKKLTFCLNAKDDLEVVDLLGIIEGKFKDLLLKLEEVPTICELTLLALGQNAGGSPIMTTDEFRELVQATCTKELRRFHFEKVDMLHRNVNEKMKSIISDSPETDCDEITSEDEASDESTIRQRKDFEKEYRLQGNANKKMRRRYGIICSSEVDSDESSYGNAFQNEQTDESKALENFIDQDSDSDESSYGHAFQNEQTDESKALENFIDQDSDSDESSYGHAFQNEQTDESKALEKFIDQERKALENFIDQEYEALKNFRDQYRSWEVVATYLRDIGAIIYFKGLDFMVIDPHWFGHAIFGYLLNPFLCEVKDKPAFKPKNGIVKAEELDQLLKDSLLGIKGSKNIDASKISIEMLIQLMKKFNLCYEYINDKNGRQYLIPVLMGDANDASMKGECKRQWKDARRIEAYVRQDARRTEAYVGHRLQCADTERTFLTPGFFPRLQMILYTMCVSEGWVAPEDLSKTNLLEVNMFQISINGPGHEILVEYGAQAGYFVDVFTRSDRDYSEVVKFVQEHFIEKIREFCASQQGCIGVSLVEGRIRKECVSSLTLCKYRTGDTSVLTSRLLDEIPKCPGNIYTQYWGAIDGSDPPLGRSTEYAAVVQGGILMLDDDQQQVRDAQAGYPRNQLQAVGDALSIPLGPVYLTHNVGLWRKLVSGLYYGRVIPLRLHVQCQCDDGNCNHDVPTHRVASQRGRLFYLMDQNAMRVQPWASKMYFLLCLAVNVGLTSVPAPGVSLAANVLGPEAIPFTRTAYCSLSVEELLEGEEAASTSNDTLRSKLQDYLAQNPEYGWKTKFLGESNIEKHFGLSKARVRGQPNSPYIWICDSCKKQDKGQVKYEHC